MTTRAARPALRLAISALDAVDQPGAQRARGHQQALEGGARGVSRKLVEQVREVLADLLVGGEQAQVLVVAGGARVVVAGADVAVAAQLVALAADHQGELAVRLQAHDAVDHVHARLLQLARPGDVCLLVEPGLDLHQGQHLLAGLRGVDQRIDDRRVATGAVQRLLDGHDLGVVGRLLQERLDADVENES